MNRIVQAAALSAMTVLGSAAAAEAAEPVAIALFDMSAMAPDFGPGAAGPGMMGRGGFGPGGMMGMGGFGPGSGGMMGGGFGPGFGGMMGGGMMSIRADRTSVKAGEVTFNVTNWSRNLLHEMMVVAVDDANASLPYDYRSQQVVEDKIKVVGETEELEPNGSEPLSLTLAAGTYLLICNIPGHYGAGMQAVFTVTE